MSTESADLAARIRAALREHQDAARAPKMQAYMKSAMPYLGVPVPLVRRLAQTEGKQQPAESLPSAAANLWRRAEFREERYAATALTALPILKGDLELLDLHTEMIVTGAWWDHVDEVSHRIGDLLVAHPQTMTPILLRWSTDPDHWLRRSSIIAQVGLRQRVDQDLLTRVILANAGEGDFFLRKAIGWALRDHARVEPEWVRAFVAEHASQLSPLSRREALKRLS